MNRDDTLRGHDENQWLLRAHQDLLDALDDVVDLDIGLADVTLPVHSTALVTDLDQVLDLDAGLRAIVPARSAGLDQVIDFDSDATSPSENAVVAGDERPGRVRRVRQRGLVFGAVVAVTIVITVTALFPGDGPRQEAGVTGGATGSTTPGSASMRAITSPLPASTRPSSEQGGTTGQTTASSASTGDARTANEREDPGRYDNVQEDEVVELVQQQGYNWRDIEYWRHDASTPGEVHVDPNGVFTNLGAKLTVIPDTPLANRARCAQATGWRDRIEFSELHVGSQLCALSRMDHYASMEVRLLPSSPASNGRFIFYGITWWN